MNLVVTWKLHFATYLSFCGNRSHLFYFIYFFKNLIYLFIYLLFIYLFIC